MIFSGFVPSAFAAQLDAAILSNQESMEPSFQFLRVIYIEYPNGGEIADSLRGQNQQISFTVDSQTSGADNLVSEINQNLKSIPSNAIASDAKINYNAILQGNKDYAVIGIQSTVGSNNYRTPDHR